MKTRHCTHLRQSHRDRMEALLNAGHIQEEIARICKVNPSTISRERKRQRENGYYDAETAQHKADVKRANSKYQGMRVEQHPNIKEFIIQELKACRAPDEIAGRLRNLYGKTIIGKDAIYTWLYSAYGAPYCQYLCTKRHRKKVQKHTPKREHIPNITPLKERPKDTIHAEGDTFVSPRKLGTPACAILVSVGEIHLLVGARIPNRKKETMIPAMQRITSQAYMDDLTLDRGIENMSHEEFGIDTFFCDPCSPWQKPRVECDIGLNRRWFVPKGTDLRKVSNEQLQTYLNILNHKWRKSLGYRSAYEVAYECGIIVEIPTKKQLSRVAFHPRI